MRPQCICGTLINAVLECSYMNLRNLHTFVIVADAGGFARAAGRLSLTQSAASRQIMALESELGIALFDRVGRSLRITSEGKDLLQRGRQLLEDATSLTERARALRDGSVGTLYVGAPTQVIENLLAPFVKGYQHRYPGINVRLLEAAAHQLQSHLDRGEVQLGIMPSGHDPFDGRLLYPIYVMAALSRSHRLARNAALETPRTSRKSSRPGARETEDLSLLIMLTLAAGRRCRRPSTILQIASMR